VVNLDAIRSIRVLAGVQETGPVRRTSTTSDAASSVDDRSDAEAEGSAKLQSYLAAARASGGSRADRVAALRAAIANGTYEIPMEKLVQGLVGGTG
jgi:anti-sigma28 factor (negative regulator of flagellin synthesis)